MFVLEMFYTFWYLISSKHLLISQKAFGKNQMREYHSFFTYSSDIPWNHTYTILFFFLLSAKINKDIPPVINSNPPTMIIQI